MELHVSYEDGYVLAESIGPIDDSAETLFREYLHPVIEQRGAKLVLDLSKSQRMNSVGLGRLVMLVVNANNHGSHVVLAACSAFVSEVVGRSRLDRYFETAETVPEAISRILDR
ncbi:MAG: STAS domain-containing protein [Planctomycetota bacterium]|jgi:anti-anti-sigma factor